MMVDPVVLLHKYKRKKPRPGADLHRRDKRTAGRICQGWGCGEIVTFELIFVVLT
jgi:hypothetical protein